MSILNIQPTFFTLMILDLKLLDPNVDIDNILDTYDRPEYILMLNPKILDKRVLNSLLGYPTIKWIDEEKKCFAYHGPKASIDASGATSLLTTPRASYSLVQIAGYNTSKIDLLNTSVLYLDLDEQEDNNKVGTILKDLSRKHDPIFNIHIVCMKSTKYQKSLKAIKGWRYLEIRKEYAVSHPQQSFHILLNESYCGVTINPYQIDLTKITSQSPINHDANYSILLTIPNWAPNFILRCYKQESSFKYPRH